MAEMHRRGHVGSTLLAVAVVVVIAAPAGFAPVDVVAAGQSANQTKTLVIESTDDSRAEYTIEVTDTISAGERADTKDSNATHPDTIRQNHQQAHGWVGAHGIDSYQFSGELTQLNITGPATASVNGKTVTKNSIQQPNQTQNATNAKQNATTNAKQSEASVVFENQTTNGSTVTIEKVILPKNGFVALHTSEYIAGPAPAAYSIIAVSQRLSAGTHRNVTIDISHAPANNPPGLNQTKLNHSQTLRAVVYRDSNNNHRFDFVRSYGDADTAFEHANGSVVHDSARVRVPEPEPQTASVVFRNQTTNGSTVTVASARLPEGGFLVIHDESYLPPESAPLESAVGVTTYLEPGRHKNVTVPLVEGAVTTNQTLVAVPYRDTNGNRRYDYIASDGFRDVAYENRTGNQTVIVNDTAAVTVESTESVSENTVTTATTTPTTTPIDTATPFRVTNLSVSNRSVHVNDELTVTVWITNPSKNRLQDEISLATAGMVVETKQVALFPRERRAVTFTHSYDAPGEYMVKVANHTKRVRVVPEGAPLTPLTTTTATSEDSASTSSRAQAESASGGLSLTDILLLVVLFIILGGLGWVLITFRKRM